MDMTKKTLRYLLIVFAFKGMLCFGQTSPASDLKMTSQQPILVAASLIIDKIEKVDSVKQTFILHGTLITRWTNNRSKKHLCTSPIYEKGVCIYIGKAAENVLSSIWHPDLKILNASDIIHNENQKLIISKNNQVTYEIQFNGELHSKLNLRNMPFDEQTLKINLESFSWDYRHLDLKINEVIFHHGNSHLTHGWAIKGLNHHCNVNEEPREHKRFYQCVINVELRRLPHYFIIRFIAPTFLFVLVAWLSFITSPLDRMRLSLSCLFTLVAYELYITNKIPSIHYITKIDLLFVLGIFSVCLTILYHAIEAKRSRDEQIKTNRPISFIPRPLPLYWRWLIIASYFIGILLITFF